MDGIEILWWHWVVLAGVLLALEALGAGGFLLGFAVSALVLMGVSSVIDLSWYTQIISYALLGVVLSFWYVKRFRGFNSKSDAPLLNHRMAQLVGREAKVVSLLGQTLCKVQIGDTLWRATATSELVEGDEVRVVGVEEDALVVEKQHGDSL